MQDNETRTKSRLNERIILNYIKENNLTIQEFCQRCKISKSTYYKIMNRENIRLLSFIKIASIIKLPLK
ncbi:MAG: helix-turn-helix domain-containing protein, partial [Clostridia bacterium]|nr:helix-turn-helix domain-containing protein [Clostridia bacterium]